MRIAQPGQQQRLMLPMSMKDKIIIPKINAPLGAMALNIEYYS